MTNPIEKLNHALQKLPGIGQKTASRLSFFLLKAPVQISQDLSEALAELHQKVKLCAVCCNVTHQEKCPICLDGRRDPSLICVVSEPSDVSAIEKTGSFHGVYHVLHGTLSPLDGVGPDDLKIRELLLRLHALSMPELIFAFDATVEGDATALYLAQTLKPLKVKLSRLAFGIPMGSELEYMDPSTLHRALEERREIH